jgi:hypothetical protein
MPITRTPIIDDDGSGTTGTTIDNAWKQEFYDQIDGALVGGESAEFIDCTAGGNFALSATNAVHILQGNAATTPPNLTWTGGTGKPGERLYVMNRNVGVLRVPHLSSAGTILNMVISAPTPIGQFGSAHYLRYGNVWVLQNHEQGAWITPAFSAANFTATGGMTWTVAAGNVSASRYRLDGRTLWVAMVLASTTIGGTMSQALFVLNANYGSFTSAGSMYLPVGRLADSTGIPQATLVVDPSATSFRILKSTFGNFSAGACDVGFTVAFEVQ